MNLCLFNQVIISLINPVSSEIINKFLKLSDQKTISQVDIDDLPFFKYSSFLGGRHVTLFKNKLAGEQLSKLGLNERQLKAVEYVKEKGKITNREYQELNETSDRTASRDLENLVGLGIFIKEGEKKGTSYRI